MLTPHNLRQRTAGLLSGERGLTLVEIVAASVIGALVAGGTMMAFVTAQKLTQIASTQVEATYYSQQTLERFRNKIACRQAGEGSGDTWFDEACQGSAPVGKTKEQLPAGASRWVVEREYEVSPQFLTDANRVANKPDYFKVTAKTTWSKPE